MLHEEWREFFHLTVRYKHYDAFLYLVHIFNDTNIFHCPDQYGNTIFHIATSGGHHQVRNENDICCIIHSWEIRTAYGAVMFRWNIWSNKIVQIQFIISAELHQIDSEHLIVPCHVYGLCVCVFVHVTVCEVSYFKNQTQVLLCPKPKSSRTAEVR